MPQFKYKARDEKGTLHENVLIAETLVELRQQLKEKGLYLIDAEDAEAAKVKGMLDLDLDSLIGKYSKVKLKDMVIFSRQFSALINAGVAMMRALSLMSKQSESYKLRTILDQVKNDVEQGISLSDAFAKHPKTFDTLYVSMIRAGETGGVLDEVLNRIAKFMEDRARLIGQVKSAMAYPAVVTVLALIIFFIMLTFVLPQFSQLFGRLGGELPAYTQFLINISEFLRSAWLIVLIAAAIGLAFLFKQVYATDTGRYQIDKFSLKLPIFGSLFKKVAVARFTRTFGTLVRSGVPILNALEIVEESAGNAVLAQTVAGVRNEVTQGGTISEPLSRSLLFPAMVVSMIAIGEETGELDAMLNKIADFYDMEVEAAVDALTSLLEPLMIVVLGGLVGAVIVGMYLPLFAIFDKIGG
ncbi:MAG: type II secretion system F family protein [Vampirovibrionia bacterium]